MKTLFSILTLLVYFFLGGTVHAQTGNAIIFDYDANGQRVLRYLDPLAALNKFGDTLTEQSLPDTIQRKGHALLSNNIIIKAYPNPVANELIIENLSWKDTYRATVKIYDVTGKFIQSRAISTAKDYFSLSSVVPGTYQVHYYLDEELITTWKIIKQ